MADDAVGRQQLEQRDLEQSLVEEQLPGRGPPAGVRLQTLLNEHLQGGVGGGSLYVVHPGT